MGVSIPKVYKKGEKLVVGVPYEVVTALRIKDGDEVDFFKYTDKYFIFAKKSDIVSVITGKQPSAEAQQFSATRRAQPELAAPELNVLKKLDTLRYGERTRDSVHGILSDQENQVLQSLLKRKIVTLFKKDTDKDYKYSIPRDIYDRFLYGKRGKAEQPRQETRAVEVPRVQRGHWTVRLKEQNRYAEMLEGKGYLVLPSEAEATAMSTLLEESIRMGLIVGTRAFNKKYYVALKAFVTENAVPILKLIESKSMQTVDIARTLGMEEDAARTVLCLLAESGDVTEVRKDIFKAA